VLWFVGEHQAKLLAVMIVMKPPRENSYVCCTGKPRTGLQRKSGRSMSHPTFNCYERQQQGRACSFRGSRLPSQGLLWQPCAMLWLEHGLAFGMGLLIQRQCRLTIIRNPPPDDQHRQKRTGKRFYSSAMQHSSVYMHFALLSSTVNP
jgi:hypothetical protein